MNRVQLLVFNAVLGVLDYRVPPGMEIEIGAVVVAPLGPRQIIGIVWEADRLAGTEVPDAKLRPLLEVLPVPPLAAPLRRLIEWTADYYCAPIQSVARMALSSAAALRGGSTTTEYRLSGLEPARLTPQRAAAMDALHGEQASIRELAEIASVSEGVLRGMANSGLLEAVTVDLDRPYARARADFAVPDLSPDQQAAADRFVEAVRAAQVRALPARRRHRIGQDRMLFRSHRRGDHCGAAGAGAAARNRADREFPAPLRGALRHAPDPVAQLGQGERAAAGMARGGERRGASRRRRAFGAVPAVCQSRPDRRR